VRLIAIFSIATVIALAFQTSFTRLLPIDVLMPNLVLVLAVNLGLRYYSAAAAMMAFGIGYATDAFSGGHLGINALLFSLVFILTYGLSRTLLSSASAIGVIAAFGGVIFIDLGNYLVTADFASRGSLGPAVPAILIQAAITALCAPAIFSFMAGTTRLIGLRQRGWRE
jgi:rod shape-determining protein MreD